MSELRGTRVGPYEIAALIGVGGMGEVYRATDTNLKRDVALKVLPASLVTDPNRLARLQREAELLAALNHPNVAHIYGLERSDGRTALVMELIEGLTLAERIAQGALPPNEAINVALQIVSALEAAHERGIVHRDLKPQNIKLKADGTVKVLDFGIAKALEARAISGPQPAALTSPSMTEAGVVLGTAAYMSPEQARGKPVDRRTDVWAFGCVLYEMLTGKRAFEGDDMTTTLARVLEREPDMRRLPSGLPPTVRTALELCLQKDPKKRVRDIGDVRLALEGELAHATSRRPLWRRTLPIAASVAIGAVLAGALVAMLVKAAQTGRSSDPNRVAGHAVRDHAASNRAAREPRRLRRDDLARRSTDRVLRPQSGEQQHRALRARNRRPRGARRARNRARERSIRLRRQHEPVLLRRQPFDRIPCRPIAALIRVLGRRRAADQAGRRAVAGLPRRRRGRPTRASSTPRARACTAYRRAAAPRPNG